MSNSEQRNIDQGPQCINQDARFVSLALTFQQVIGFLSVLAIARILGAIDYGEYAVVKNTMAICYAIGPLGLGIGLMKYLARFYGSPKLQSSQFNHYRVFASIVNCAVPAISLFVAYILGLTNTQTNHFWQILPFALASLPFATDIVLFGAYCRVVDRISYFSAVSLIVQSALNLTLALIAALFFKTALAVVIANTLAIILTSALLTTTLGSNSNKLQFESVEESKIEKLSAFAVLSESFWMGCSQFAYSIMKNMDVLFLGGLVSAHLVASYSLITTYAFVIFTVPLAISQSLGPDVARAYERNDLNDLKTIYHTYFDKACVISSFIAGGIAAFADRSELVLGAGFEMSLALASLLAFGQLASAIFGPTGFALSMTKYHKQEFALLGTSTVLMAGMLYILVPLFGLLGAATSSMFIYISANICRYVLVKLYIGIWLAQFKHLLWPATALVLAYTCRLLSWATGDGLVNSIVFALLYFTVYCLIVAWRYNFRTDPRLNLQNHPTQHAKKAN